MPSRRPPPPPPLPLPTGPPPSATAAAAGSGGSGGGGDGCSDDSGGGGGGAPETWARAFTVDPQRVLYKDERVVAFWDRSPAAAVHLLIVPRHAPLVGVESLTPADAPLLDHMAAVGRGLAAEATPPRAPIPAAGGRQRRQQQQQQPPAAPAPNPTPTGEVLLGFHRWPLRSVPHLHLHALRRPFHPRWQAVRYTEWRAACGTGFIRLDTVVRRLGEG